MGKSKRVVEDLRVRNKNPLSLPPEELAKSKEFDVFCQALGIDNKGYTNAFVQVGSGIYLKFDYDYADMYIEVKGVGSKKDMAKMINKFRKFVAEEWLED